LTHPRTPPTAVVERVVALTVASAAVTNETVAPLSNAFENSVYDVAPT
jgi:hypothetical protein